MWVGDGVVVGVGLAFEGKGKGETQKMLSAGSSNLWQMFSKYVCYFKHIRQRESVTLFSASINDATLH